MLRAFFDDSKENGGVLILAGYVASVQQWMSLSDRWEQALTMRSPKWSAFKMRNVDLSNPIHVERAEYHYRIIEEFAQMGMCIAVPIPALSKVIDEFHIEPKYKNPYYLAWLITVSQFRNYHLYNGWTQPLDIYFDAQAESKMVLRAWEVMEEQNADMKPFKNVPMFRSDEEMLPLQAADLLAWWARKNWMEHGTFGNDKWLFPWEERSPGPDYLYVEIDEDGIRKHFIKTMILPDSGTGVP